MLYISLVMSLILLVVVNWIVARSSVPVTGALAACFGFALVPPCLMLVFPAVMWQAGLMSVLLLVLAVPRRGRRLYIPLSCVATLIAYGILLRSAVETQAELTEIRQQYQYESMEDRLPPRPARNAAPPAHPRRLDEMENEIEVAVGSWKDRSRAPALQRLHADSVDEFVNSAGFGIGRMLPRPDPRTLREALPDRPPVPQPDYLHPFGPASDELSTVQPDGDTGALGRLHDSGVLDFVNPRGFGFVRDRGHVAGFQLHGMTEVPAGASGWSVARLDLVGLVVHDQPVAYVSANLPQMDELRAVPTRSLDAFETAALESLRRGEDLHVRGAGDKGRMLGAIRATKQCLACHGGARGDLLGAFSYGLRREKP